MLLPDSLNDSPEDSGHDSPWYPTGLGPHFSYGFGGITLREIEMVSKENSNGGFL